MKILLAADGSECTRAAARYLAQRSHWFAGTPEIHLLCVQAPTIYPPGWEGRAESWTREAGARSRAALAVAERELEAARLPSIAAWRVGDVATEIARYVADQHIDLVVMGTHGRNALANLALGSVSAKCLATLDVPVMVVRKPPPSPRLTRHERTYGARPAKAP